jgi:hypothetical protein
MSRDDAIDLHIANTARLLHTFVQGMMDVQISLRGIRDVVTLLGKGLDSLPGLCPIPCHAGR